MHSSYIYTDKGDFEKFYQDAQLVHLILKHQNFIRHIKNKVFWSSTMVSNAATDEIFKDEDDVIPYVRRFTLDGYYHGGYQYLVVQLKKIELDRILSGKYGYFDQLLIVNEDWRTVSWLRRRKYKKIN